MNKSYKVVAESLFLLFLFLLSHAFQGVATEALIIPSKSLKGKKSSEPVVDHRFSSSLILPAYGNVYPLGYYSVNMEIGNPVKMLAFDMDTGSDLTWVQCDAPCKGCTMPLALQYKPKKNRMLSCEDPLCVAFHLPHKPRCDSPEDQCEYGIGYADESTSIGVMAMDEIRIKLTNGTVLKPQLAFGCGYEQNHPGPHPPSPTSGIIGLSNGKISLLSQLTALAITRNVLGHCLSRKNGGYLFLGSDIVPSSGIMWTPMKGNPLVKHFLAGPAKLCFNEKFGDLNVVEDLILIFDSGSSYTYLNTEAYEATIHMIRNSLKGTPLQEYEKDKTLSVCWKGSTPFNSVLDVKKYFKTFTLVFSKNTHLHIHPEAYLIISENGNVCLGILHGTEIGLGNYNLIGDITMQDTMVIYDNENHRIGWVPTNCDRLPNVDQDYSEGLFQCPASNFGILEDTCPADIADIQLVGEKDLKKYRSEK